MKLISSLLAGLFVLNTGAAEAAMSASQWSEDIDALVARLESTHPNPWTRRARIDWLNELGGIRAEAGTVPDAATAVRLMQLVASLEDTHTNLWPSAEVGFDRWFPVRFYEFTDGYFITAIHRDHAGLVGAKVVSLDGTPIAEAANRARTLRASENEFGRREAVYYLSSPTALNALELLKVPEEMTLSLLDRQGKPRRIKLKAKTGHRSMVWSQWGEMFGPVFEDRKTLVTAFGGLSPIDYRDRDESRPPHLRNRARYDFWLLPEANSIYAQVNFFLDSDVQPFESGFLHDLFQAVDTTVADKLIIDLRYNGGGDGSMAIPFVHELIKRDGTTNLNGINQPGRLFVLTGRKTFSASVTFLEQVVKHTAAMLVGEPPRSPFNHYGDPTSADLPHSKMILDVSNRYWQMSLSDDNRDFIPVHYPARFSSGDYFNGKDPALDAILAGRVLPLPKLIRESGAAPVLAIIDRITASQGQPNWWIPFELRDMRHACEDLVEAGRIEDGIAACRLNTRFYGDTWRAWDSLGDALKAAGNMAPAIDAYRKALTIKPDNWNAGHQREMLAELAQQGGAE